MKTTNIKFILPILFLFCVSAAKAQVTNFQGVWRDSTTRTEFILDLTQVGSAITGTHISMQLNGNRIDAPLESSDVSITGTANTSSEVVVTFKSSFSNTTGTAKLTKLSNQQIKWQIITKPSGEFYIPMNAVLTKQ